ISIGIVGSIYSDGVGLVVYSESLQLGGGYLTSVTGENFDIGTEYLYISSSGVTFDNVGYITSNTDLTLTGSGGVDLIVSTTTTGADANSGYIIFRGNDWNGSSNTTLTMRSQL